MSSSRQPVPPAQSLTVLSADLLAVAAKRVVEQLACGDWEPMRQLKQALDTFEAVRLGPELRDPDPQRMQINDPPPATERSVHHA